MDYKNVTLTIPENHELVARRVLKFKSPPFTKIKTLRENPDPLAKKDHDIFDLFEQLPPTCLSIFNELKIARDRNTNIIIYQPLHRTPNQKRVFNRYLKELCLIGIMCRIPSSYLQRPADHLALLINPAYIQCFDYESAKKLWGLIT